MDSASPDEPGVRPHDLLVAEDAVSTVVSTVLLVAITIVLSAAIVTFVLGLGASVTQSQPTVSFSFGTGTAAGNDTVSLTHQSGSGVAAEHLTVQIDGREAWTGDGGTTGDYTALSTWSGTVDSGDRLQLKEDTPTGIEPGDAVAVVWQDGERSGILYRGQV